MTESEFIDGSDPEFLASQYVDGQLDDDQRRQFERRLAADPELAACVKGYRAIDRHLQRLREPPELDWDRFATQVGERWAREQAHRRRGRMIRRLGGLAAAAVFGLVVTRSLLSPRPDVPTSTDRPAVMVSVGPGRDDAASASAPAQRVRFSRGGPLVAETGAPRSSEERAGPMIIACVVGGGA